MRKAITTKGDVVCIPEECDDMISTLEQENRQLRARNERLEQEKHRASSVEQISAMWRHSDGKPLVFARMLESFHGIGEILEEPQTKDNVSVWSGGQHSSYYYDKDRNK